MQQHTGISPLDIFAIGLVNGDIMIHNIKTDETLQRFHQDWGTVTGISFRTGNDLFTVKGAFIFLI